MAAKDTLDLLTHAYMLAAEAHAGQTRKESDEPYINHPVRVARMAYQAGLTPAAVAAAVLHDTLEDTSLEPEKIATYLGSRVLHLVQTLTKAIADDASKEAKAAYLPGYYGAILNEPEACAIKILDRVDNLHDFARMARTGRNVKWPASYLRRTHEEFVPLLAVAPPGEFPLGTQKLGTTTDRFVRDAFTDALEALRAGIEAGKQAIERDKSFRL